MSDQSIIEQVRTIVVEQGWSLRIKKCWGVEYVFAVKGQRFERKQECLGLLHDLEATRALDRARRLSEPPRFFDDASDRAVCFKNDGSARKESWRKALVKMFSDTCMRCGWNLAPCDAHHILPKSKGGTQTVENGILLCPNCHRLADCGLIPAEELASIRNATVPQRPLWRG
jgi:hypothetical protein